MNVKKTIEQETLNVRWRKKQRRTKTINTNSNNNNNNCAVIIIFAARRKAEQKCAEWTNRNKLLNINNQWKKISITKHLLFKKEREREGESFYFMHDFVVLCLLYLHVVQLLLPGFRPIVSTSVNIFCLPSQRRWIEASELYVVNPPSNLEWVSERVYIFTDNLNERVPITLISL